MFLQFGRVNTDKGALYWDNDQILRVGDLVYKEVREGGEPDYVKADDGEYRADDGRRIVVEDGVVREIEQGTEPDADKVRAASEDPADKPADEPDKRAEEAHKEDERVKRLEDTIALQVKAMEEVNNRLAQVESKNAEILERLAKVESAPAAKPADAPEKNEDVAAQRRAALAAIRGKNMTK